jgi:diguanylate cyclase (GGDEF)-like protein
VRHKREGFITAICCVTIVAIWFADRFAGEDFRFGFVYMLPLAASAWWGTRRVALSCAVAASVALVANDLAFRATSSALSNAWNEFTRVTTFFAVGMLISLVRDSAARARAESERVFHLAVTDHLTGLYNRHYLMEQLHRIHRAAARHRRAYALLAIDLDGFKQINDSFGHAGGDTALVAFATDLKGAARADEILVRMGGDEFLVLLPDGQATDAAVLAERILKRVRETTARDRVRSVSVGVVAWRPSSTADELLAEADRLVYESKRGGGGRMTVAPGGQLL